MSSAQALPKTKTITIQIASGATKGEVFTFSKPVIKIGRGPENDVVLNFDAKVSRNHVEIQQTQGLFQIHNLTEKNAMMVNGKLLKVAILDGNTSIVIGDTQFNILFNVGASKSKQNSFAVVPGGRAVPPRVPQGASVPAVRGVQLPNKITNELQVRQAAPQQWAPPQYSAPNQQGDAGMSADAFATPTESGSRRSQLIIGFIMISIIAIAAAMYFGKPNKNPPKPVGLKTTQQYEEELEKSAKETEGRTKDLERTGQTSIQYNMAQQHYVKGFRDYQHQQYARAITSLKSALSYYPQHELARRYLTFAQKKQEDITQSLMDSGARYKGQGNNRMCVASYSKALRTIEDTTDKNYKAAEQYMLECEAQMKERY
jgi:hypothetical protein